VPTINLHGADDGVSPLASEDWAAPHFSGSYERRVVQGVGHNLPQESPAAVVKAVSDLLAHD
jgi:pimeloyl-ACP methyl ester carboxylesterase